MTFLVQFIGRRMFSASRAGVNMTTTSSTRTPRAMVMWFNEFSRRAKDLLETQGAGLCHEMAKYSMPTRANTALTANDAIKKYAAENAALAGVAFKPQTNRSPEFWVLSGYTNVADYVMKRGFPFQSSVHQNLAQNGKWALLDSLMRRKGMQTPDEAPSKKYVVDDAKLSDFIRWKSQYKKNPNRQPYYVKNKSTIQKIAQEGKLMNYASVVINGWLKAAKGLGNKLPSGVQKQTWPSQYSSLGWGSGSVKKIDRYKTQMTIRNDYANQNGIFNSSIQQSIWRRRIAIMNQETTKMFKDMQAYWKSLKV